MGNVAVSRSLGSTYALAASVLIAAQAPLSSPAAKHLSGLQFILLTQIALLVSVPLLLISSVRERATGEPATRLTTKAAANVRNIANNRYAQLRFPRRG